MSSEIVIQPWSANEYSNLALVQEVKKHPCLYNNTIPEYSQKEVTGRVWAEIAEKFGCSVPLIRKKWKNIRTVYYRDKILQCRGKKRKKKHYLDKHLTFMLPFTHSRNLMKEFAKITRGESVVDLGNDEEDETTPHSSNSNPAQENILRTAQRKVEIVKPTIVKPAGTTRVQPNQTEVCENWQNNLAYIIAPCETEKDHPCPNIADSEDFRKQFMMSLLPEIEEMSEPKFRSFKRKILDLIDDIKTVTEE